MRGRVSGAYKVGGIVTARASTTRRVMSQSMTMGDQGR